MIWFNLKEIENRIISDELTDKEGFSYFLASAILGVIGTYFGSQESTLTFVSVIVGILLTIWGSFLIFKTNEAGDGKDFFKRYFALSWVIGVRLFVFAFIATILYMIIYLVLFTPEESIIKNNDILKLIISSLIMLLYYFLLNNSFRRVSNKESSN